MSVKSFKTGTRSVSLLAGNVPEHHILIAESTVGAGGAASVTFSNIPADYQHLQIRSVSKNTSGNDAIISINGNSVGRRHVMYGEGSAAFSTTAADGNGYPSAASTGTSVFGVAILDILDYSNSSKNKTFRALGGYDYNGSGTVSLTSWLYSTNTNAITSITISGNSNFVQHSTFALYGIK